MGLEGNPHEDEPEVPGRQAGSPLPQGHGGRGGRGRGAHAPRGGRGAPARRVGGDAGLGLCRDLEGLRHPASQAGAGSPLRPGRTQGGKHAQSRAFDPHRPLAGIGLADGQPGTRGAAAAQRLPAGSPGGGRGAPAFPRALLRTPGPDPGSGPEGVPGSSPAGRPRGPSACGTLRQWPGSFRGTPWSTGNPHARPGPLHLRSHGHGPEGPAGSGAWPRPGDPADDRHPAAPAPEQSDPHRGARRGEDGRGGRAGGAHRPGRRPGPAPGRRDPGTGHGIAAGGRLGQGRVREPRARRHGRGQGQPGAHHPLRRRGPRHDRRGRAGGPGRRGEPPEAGPGPRGTAHHRGHHVVRVQEVLREGRRAGEAFPGGQDRGAGRGRGRGHDAGRRGGPGVPPRGPHPGRGRGGGREAFQPLPSGTPAPGQVRERPGHRLRQGRALPGGASGRRRGSHPSHPGHRPRNGGPGEGTGGSPPSDQDRGAPGAAFRAGEGPGGTGGKPGRPGGPRPGDPKPPRRTPGRGRLAGGQAAFRPGEAEGGPRGPAPGLRMRGRIHRGRGRLRVDGHSPGPHGLGRDRHRPEPEAPPGGPHHRAAPRPGSHRQACPDLQGRPRGSGETERRLPAGGSLGGGQDGDGPGAGGRALWGGTQPDHPQHVRIPGGSHGLGPQGLPSGLRWLRRGRRAHGSGPAQALQRGPARRGGEGAPGRA